MLKSILKNPIPRGLIFALSFSSIAFGFCILVLLGTMIGCEPSARTKIEPSEVTITKDLDEKRPVRDRSFERVITIHPPEKPHASP